MAQDQLPSFVQYLTFLMYFSTNMSYKKISGLLVNFTQDKRESFKDFLGWFNRMALEIKDLPNGVPIHAIMTRL